MNAKNHIETAHRIFFPAARQSFEADLNDTRKELSLASAGLDMSDPDEAAILSQIFAADMQLRQMETASGKLAASLTELRGAVARSTVSA